jgi:hypothetical protein
VFVVLLWDQDHDSRSNVTENCLLISSLNPRFVSCHVILGVLVNAYEAQTQTHICMLIPVIVWKIEVIERNHMCWTLNTNSIWYDCSVTQDNALILKPIWSYRKTTCMWGTQRSIRCKEKIVFPSRRLKKLKFVIH